MVFGENSVKKKAPHSTPVGAKADYFVGNRCEQD
jgi:hypothetical protein